MHNLLIFFIHKNPKLLSFHSFFAKSSSPNFSNHTYNACLTLQKYWKCYEVLTHIYITIFWASRHILCVHWTFFLLLHYPSLNFISEKCFFRTKHRVRHWIINTQNKCTVRLRRKTQNLHKSSLLWRGGQRLTQFLFFYATNTQNYMFLFTIFGENGEACWMKYTLLFFVWLIRRKIFSQSRLLTH